MMQILSPAGPFARRRMVAFSISLFAAVMTTAIVWLVGIRLGRPEFLTGYTLLASGAGLFLLTLRKRWLALPLGSVAGWFQGHVYTGLFALFVFGLHTGFTIKGWFEISLAALFLWVSLSGLYLWILSRQTPKRLAAVGRDSLHADIPRKQVAIAEEAYRLAVESTKLGEGVTLAEHFQRELLRFFQKSRGLAYQIAPNTRWRRVLLRELGDLDRYLGQEGRQMRDRLCDLVRLKDDLDFQWAMQNRIRLWLTLHLSGIWALIVLVAFHVISVHRFHGGG